MLMVVEEVVCVVVCTGVHALVTVVIFCTPAQVTHINTKLIRISEKNWTLNNKDNVELNHI